MTVDALVKALPPAFQEVIRQRSITLDWFIKEGLLADELIKGRNIVDWESGDNAFSIALLLYGAKKVFAIDSWRELNTVPEALFSLPSRIEVIKCDIECFSKRRSEILLDGGVDLVFSNTVTEHIQDMPSALSYVNLILNEDGTFFTNHDNYYQPVGSHDHGFLTNNGGMIVHAGPNCWDSEEKCKKSAKHRSWVKTKMPWTWDASLDKSLDPTNCEGCAYFCRSQPWSHLRFQNVFCDLFPSSGFRTGLKGATLNKLTPFQLRQFVIESGMRIFKETRHHVTNIPSDDLTQITGLSSEELTTWMFRLSAKKATAS